MKETGIIFKGEMVNAIRDLRKSQTRRVVKGVPVRPVSSLMATDGSGDVKFVRSHTFGGHHAGLSVSEWIKCPYGQVGDRLWVRETLVESSIGSDYPHYAGYAASFPHYNDPDENRYDLRFHPDATVYKSRPFSCRSSSSSQGKKVLGMVPWWDFFKDETKTPRRVIPSIHMPRWASRINLEITDIRVERLQDISYHDAVVEGCGRFLDEQQTDAEHRGQVRDNFKALWDSINGKKYPWKDNSWVWVLGFKVNKQQINVF